MGGRELDQHVLGSTTLTGRQRRAALGLNKEQ